jgi:hypothetical protein
MAKRLSLPSPRLTQVEAESIASAFLKAQDVADTGWVGASYQWDEEGSARPVWRLTRRSNAPALARTTPWHIWIDDESGKVIRSGTRDGKPVTP